jgi:hypothetical protein
MLGTITAGQTGPTVMAEEHLKTYQHFIGGQYVDPIGGQWIDSMDPYRGEAWAKIPKGCARDVDRAVTTASQAMREGPWPKLTASARGKLMLKLADLVAANVDWRKSKSGTTASFWPRCAASSSITRNGGATSAA